MDELVPDFQLLVVLCEGVVASGYQVGDTCLRRPELVVNLTVIKLEEEVTESGMLYAIEPDMSYRTGSVSDDPS